MKLVYDKDGNYLGTYVAQSELPECATSNLREYFNRSGVVVDSEAIPRIANNLYVMFGMDGVNSVEDIARSFNEAYGKDAQERPRIKL